MSRAALTLRRLLDVGDATTDQRFETMLGHGRTTNGENQDCEKNQQQTGSALTCTEHQTDRTHGPGHHRD